MDCAKTGALIAQLRREKGLTQKDLADALHISNKTVSKWETAAGFPDVSLLEDLCRLLEVDVPDLLRGELSDNDPVGGNMKHAKYFVCPTCGSITMTTGGASVACRGRALPALTARKAEPKEKLAVELVEDEWFITTDHPMTKDCSITFAAFATGDKIELIKKYPEWDFQLRIRKRGHGMLLWYSTRDGLLYQLL